MMNKNNHKYVYNYKLYLFNPLFTQNIFRKKMEQCNTYMLTLMLNLTYEVYNG